MAYLEVLSAYIRAINHEIRLALGPHFRWASLQINRNTVSISHTDKNNIGLSAIMLLGNFTGGEFHMDDDSVVLDETDCGTWTVIDGKKPHHSTQFHGERFSIVAFLHSRNWELPDEDQRLLKALGFRWGSTEPAVQREIPLLWVEPPALRRTQQW